MPTLTAGRIVRRYKRFLADVTLADGTTVVAHVPNTGSMAGCWEPGAPVQLSHSDDPRRKLAWTLERVDMGGGWIGINTARPNAVIAEGIASGAIPPLAGYPRLRREVAYRAADGSAGRLDIGLGDDAQPFRPRVLVEVKNVTLLDGDCLRFPDARTERGRRHLDLLMAAVAEGLRGVMVFALNRPEGDRFAPAWAIDQAYGERLQQAAAAGVEVMALRLLHEADGIRVGASVPVDLQQDGSRQDGSRQGGFQQDGSG
nr:DNA/RNA nuclease SfsA [Thiohalocapsa marina]